MFSFILQFICAFIASLGFAIYFNISKKILFLVGFTGACGWLINSVLVYNGHNTAWVYLISSIIVSFLSEYFAIKTKNPSTLFYIPAIYLLVPGYRLYTTMRYFSINDIEKAMPTMINALTNAGALALGIIIIGTLGTIRKKIISKKINITNEIK